MKSQSGTATIHQKKPDVKAEDEWAHLTDSTTGAETKIQAAEAADVTDRKHFRRWEKRWNSLGNCIKKNTKLGRYDIKYQSICKTC